MFERLLYHFEPKSGWMNDPNGLIYYGGKYHAFFQHNPYAPVWGPMHWGHAVSEDLIHWEELPIALYPDKPYDTQVGSKGGCYSGSAIEKDGLLYLFYTSTGCYGQTQSIAVSEDGVHFEKYADNPVIRTCPIPNTPDFRDPKVTKFEDGYRMVCGSGADGVGKILLFYSQDLLHWEYQGVLFESEKFGRVHECPDFFKMEDQYVLMFSKIGSIRDAVQFVLGDFDGEKFIPRSFSAPESGPQFYAPQTFLAPDGQRVMIGWLYDWNRKLPEGVDYAGALTIPRVLTIDGERMRNYPVESAQRLLAEGDELLEVTEHTVLVRGTDVGAILPENEYVESVKVLRDTKTMEVFVNGGRYSFSYWHKG